MNKLFSIFSPFYQKIIKLNPNLDGTVSPSISNFTDFYLEVAKGNIPGHSTVIIKGHNPSQSSASGEVDICEFGNLQYLTAAEKMKIKSNNANDSSSGTGAQSVLVEGVAQSGEAIDEIISTNGLLDVLTSKDYLRINSLTGLDVGAANWNVGTITATADITGTVQDQMNPTEGDSKSSHYTVPLNHELYIMTVELNSARTAPGKTPVVNFKFYGRQGGKGKSWIQSMNKKVDVAVTDELDIVLPFPDRNISRTDMRFTSDTTENSTETTCRYCGVLVETIPE